MALLVTPVPRNRAKIACAVHGTLQIVSADNPRRVSALVQLMERRHKCAGF